MKCVYTYRTEHVHTLKHVFVRIIHKNLRQKSLLLQKNNNNIINNR